MKTRYDEIVDVSAIGQPINTRNLGEILAKAMVEDIEPSHHDSRRVLLVAIDMQQDFMENGSLGVPKSHGDVERLTRWIYGNMPKITNIAVSIDTHNPFQIFHPCWWIDRNGKNPAPFTLITRESLDKGDYLPVVMPVQSREYVMNLEASAKKTLCIWPYHCLQGTSGCALENQFSNMVYFFSVARKAMITTIVKGRDLLTEMYGIIKPEYDPKNFINLGFLNQLGQYDMVIIAGEAKSHCVMESIRQMLEYYKDRPDVTNRVFILQDCMSSIPGFEKVTEDAFADFKLRYGVNLVDSVNFAL